MRRRGILPGADAGAPPFQERWRLRAAIGKEPRAIITKDLLNL